MYLGIKKMDAARHMTVGEIIDQLLADRLIDACHMTADAVTIVQGAKRHSFSYGKARTFLMGMLRGRSWNRSAADKGADQPVAMLRAVETSPFPLRARVAESQRFEPALDELLRMATELHIIERFERDPVGGTVTIVLSACETELREEEALSFLAECILHKLNELHGSLSTDPTVSPWSRGDGGWPALSGPVE